MSDATPPVPDLAGDYLDRYQDNDVGTLDTRYTIRQDGERIWLQLSREDYDHSVQHESHSGVIEKVYADRPLVRLRLDDGTRRYFHLQHRGLVDVEHLSQVVARTEVDFRDERQVRALLRILGAMAAVLDSRPVPDPESYSQASVPPPGRDDRWGRRHDFLLGPEQGPHYRFWLQVNLDGTQNVNIIWLQNLEGGQSVHVHFSPSGPGGPEVSLAARCWPEHHPALRNVIQEQATAWAAVR